MRVTKIYSTRTDEKGQRLIKFLLSGRNNVRECLSVSPFGIDSNPLEDYRGVQSETSVSGEEVFLGVINKSLLADPGEMRMYSLDSSGELKTYVWLKNTGDILLGGDTNNLTRFQDLESGFNQLKSDFNAHVQNYNTHIHPVPGGSSGVPSVLSTNSTASISGAKINYIYVS